MTPEQRFRIAASFQEPDMVPLLLGVPERHVREWAGLSEKDYYQDREKRLEAMVRFYLQRWPEVIPGVFLGPGYEMADVALSYGFKSSWESPGAAHKPTLEEVKKISRPFDPNKDGITPSLLEQIPWYVQHTPRQFRERYGGLPWRVQAYGPLMVTGGLLSWAEMFRLMRQDPPFIKYLAEIHTEGMVAWIKAAEKAYRDQGIEPSLFVVDEAVPMVSPRDLREFFLPYGKRLFAASSSRWKWFHCDNDVVPVPFVLPEMGCNVYMGNFSDYRILKGLVGHKVALQGNIPALRVLAEGSPEAVERACQKAIRELAPGGGFILSSGGGVSQETPLENLEAMVRAWEKYGRYPVEMEEAGPPTFPVSRGASEEERVLGELARWVALGDGGKVSRLVARALELELPPTRMVEEGLRQGIALAVEKFHDKEYAFPDILACHGAWERGMGALEPLLPPETFKGQVVLGVAMGNIHQSGIALVKVMLLGAGFKVYDLGVSVPPQHFVEEARAREADIVAIGVYTRERLPVAAEVVKGVKAQGLKAKTLVGGIAFTRASALSIGADAYAEDAFQAVEEALKLIPQGKARRGIRGSLRSKPTAG